MKRKNRTPSLISGHSLKPNTPSEIRGNNFQQIRAIEYFNVNCGRPHLGLVKYPTNQFHNHRSLICESACLFHNSKFLHGFFVRPVIRLHTVQRKKLIKYAQKV